MSLRPASRSVARLARRAGQESWAERQVAEEVPVAISYGGATHAVMMATPADLEDFALGFSLSERIIASPAQVEAVAIVEAGEGIDLQISLTSEAGKALERRRRSLAGPVGCGLCGLESIEEALMPLPQTPGGAIVSASEIRQAFANLPGLQTLNAATGAVHAAGFWLRGKGVAVIREDVGRHNALDKLIGALARAGIEPANGMMLLTSRVSVDMVQKAALAGCAILAAVSAPTALAVRAAEAAGITLVALVRGADHEIFTHAGRVQNGEAAHVA